MNPTLHAQILTLKKYQAWRTGEDARTMEEAGILPAAITSALDTVIAIAENHLRDGMRKAKCSQVAGFDAADMASQGAQGFRDGLKAAADAIHNLQQQASNE